MDPSEDPEMNIEFNKNIENIAPDFTLDFDEK
jgi:hypothetical protein